MLWKQNCMDSFRFCHTVHGSHSRSQGAHGSVQTLVTFRPLNKELPEPALVSHYWYPSCMSHCCEGPVGPCNGTSSAMLGNGSNSLLRKEPGIQPPRPAAAVPHNSWLANGQLWWVQKNEKNRSFSFWSRLEKLGERWRKVKWVAFPSKEVNYHSKKNWIKGNWCQTEKKKNPQTINTEKEQRVRETAAV